MPEKSAELLITLSLDGSDDGELDELTHQLRSEIEDLNIDSIKNVAIGDAPEGTMALEWVAVGQMVVTLAPIVIPPLFALLKSWVERKPTTPVKIKIKVGKKTTQIEYDPTKTSAEDLEQLVKSLAKTIKK